MPLFDRIVTVDWSAAAVPATGRDSIWIGEGGRPPLNMPTRSSAMDWLKRAAADALAVGERILIGFDFAFGYPLGVAARFGRGWTGVWDWLRTRVRDAADNSNNRFAVASEFNALFPDVEGPLWGLPRGRRVEGVLATKPPFPPVGIAERRAVERIVPSASPTWKLAYAGAVGGQTLLGIARLEGWRSDPTFRGHFAVWPFETAFAEALDASITVAEIYPSLFPIERAEGEVRDAAQVRLLADGFAALDGRDELRPFLAGPDDPALRAAAMEEGWIVGVGNRPLALS